MQEIIFLISILIMSVVIHEVTHGYVANFLGDPTAALQGRLTLNPIKHIDLFGSIILPGIAIITNAGFIIGWAKPVPYNPYNLRGGKWGPAIVALAGPASNFFIAIVFAMVIRFGLVSGPMLSISGFIVYINLLLGIFNLIPIPPLDGSKVISALIPFSMYERWNRFELLMQRFGLIVVFLFIFLLWGIFSTFISFLFILLTGGGIPII